MQREKEAYRKELELFREKTKSFYNGEMTVAEYKGFSGYYGSYAQRGAKQSMLRLRLTGGEIDKDKLKFIADSIEKYGIERVHFTTCQTVQVHDLSCEVVCDLIEEALDHDIITRGGGGDYPRNVMCAPLSGVEQGEYFDVMPYAKAAGEFLLGKIKDIKLPRKLKVCFSNSKKNETHATFRDLGFVAKENQKFDVYCAGGLGNKPKFGVKVAEDVLPGEILYCIQTMLDIFQAHGNYTKRSESRTRFLQDTLGVEGLKKVFAEQFEENKKKCDLDLHVTEHKVEKEGKETFAELPSRVVAQKQSGLYAVYYHPIGGVPDRNLFARLYQVMKDMEAVAIRLTPEEGLYVINLTKEETEQVLEATKESACSRFETSTACIGAAICQVGIGNSQKMLELCVERVQKENFKPDTLPKIRISGCPSSCAGHQIGTIGLRGGKKPTEDGPKDAFAVFVDGCDLQGNEQMGQEIGVMLMDKIPEFFVKLGHAVEAAGMNYEAFAKTHGNQIIEIAKEFI